jgi:hypothetical protein
MREFCVAYLIGLFPLWVTFLVQFVILGPKETSHIIFRLLSSSELFFASSALISSYTYFLWGDAEEEPATRGQFPHRFMFLLVGLVIVVAWSVLISLDRALPILGTRHQLDPEAIALISRTTFGVSVVLMYLFLVFKNATSAGYSRPSREDEDNFLDSWGVER